MRIAIDCRWILPKLSGVGKHTETLLEGLAQVDRVNRYLFLKAPLVNFDIFSRSNQWKLPRLLKRLDVNLYHSPNFMISLMIPKTIKVVITVHDLIPWKFPDYTPRARKTKFNWLFKLIIKRAVRRADRIIAVSHNTARDIQECLGVPAKKIKVVYNSVGPEFFVPLNITKNSNPGKKMADYILFVGRADPYKNLAGLVRAYGKLVKKHNITHKLMIVGEEDPRYPEVPELVKKLGLEDKVIFYGYVEQERLVNLYRRASVLVMPSLYEGFGLPVLEAMICGVPVIASNTPALAEIAGGNALLVDPRDTGKLTDAIYKVISDADFAGQLAEKGRVYANQFTIEKMAKKTVTVYESCFSA